MRIAVINQRLHLIVGAGAVDVHTASDGRFGPDAASAYEGWAEFTEWAAAADLPAPEPFSPAALGSPSPAPRQVFGIGLNYSEHAAESGFAKPDTAPPVFTKFPSCITGPYAEITLPPGGHNDWEVELVVIIGRTAAHVPAAFGLGARGRPVHRPGHLRADPANGRHATPVQPGQVLPRLRAGRPVPGHAGRVRQSRRPGAVLLDQRRADAEGPDQGADLRRGRADRAAVPGHPAAARRHHLHRHAVAAWAWAAARSAGWPPATC